MRLLFFTDLHLAERPPLARNDSYVEDLFAKLEELKGLAADCDVSVFGGDWLHWPRPTETSHRLVRRLIECLRDWPTELYTVAGNHDLPSEGMKGLHRMPLGVVLEALKDGPVQLLDEPERLSQGKDVDVMLWPVNWQHDIDRRPDLYSASKVPGTAFPAFLVQVTHGMVMPPGGGWPFPAIGMDQIETEADVVLLGHMHWQTGVHQVNGTWFAGPGAIARTSRSESEMKRQPAALIVTLKRDAEPQFDEIQLKSARPAEEVFTYAGDGAAPTDGLFAGYVAALETGMNLEGLTVEEAVAAAEGKVPSDVMELAKEYLGRAGL
jgi:DNA repair exonuclease SbcCD nuclease subunit